MSGSTHPCVGGGPLDGQHWPAPVPSASDAAPRLAILAFHVAPGDAIPGDAAHLYLHVPSVRQWEYQGTGPWDGVLALHDLRKCMSPNPHWP